METKEIQKATNNVQVQATPGQLLELAINKDLDIEKLSKLMELQREYNADLARKSFFRALTDFQAKVPELRKSKEVSFGDTKYHYAPLADIVRQIKDTCRDCLISYRWEIQDDKEEIKVSCIITHEDGHSEKTTMTASPDVSGKKNSIQARGSSIEYMKRYTLIGALGLSTADTDIDARFREYEYNVDDLHKKFMELYNQVIQIDPSKSTWHPDNWLIERNGKNYVRAIGDIRKELVNLKKPKPAK